MPLINDGVTRPQPQVEEPTTFDFGDGKGPVPAHRHPFGGGWVADSAIVEAGVWVDPDARVFGNAQARDFADLFGNAKLSGNAMLGGSVTLCDDAHMSGSAVLSGDNIELDGDTKLDAAPVVVAGLFKNGYAGDDWTVVCITSPVPMVVIGCQRHSPAYWRKHAREIAGDFNAARGSVPKLMKLLDMVYGKAQRPRKPQRRVVKR